MRVPMPFNPVLELHSRTCFFRPQTAKIVFFINFNCFIEGVKSLNWEFSAPRYPESAIDRMRVLNEANKKMFPKDVKRL